MAGYRDTQTGFDPMPRADYSRPLRPFNAWQWLGVGFIVAGIGVILAAFASQFGWLPPKIAHWVTSGTSLCLIGALFVNSRREPVDLSPEDRAKVRRRTWIVAAVALAVCIAVAALVIYSKGAF